MDKNIIASCVPALLGPAVIYACGCNKCSNLSKGKFDFKLTRVMYIFPLDLESRKEFGSYPSVFDRKCFLQQLVDVNETSKSVLDRPFRHQSLDFAVKQLTINNILIFV